MPSFFDTKSISKGSKASSSDASASKDAVAAKPRPLPPPPATPDTVFSRVGKPFSDKEKVYLRRASAKGLSLEVMAAKCNRPIPEIKAFLQDSHARPATIIEFETADYDICLAHRYLYYIHSINVISDTEYDKLEATTILKRDKRFDDMNCLLKPGSSKPDDYPIRIRALAMYLGLRYGKTLTAPPPPATT